MVYCSLWLRKHFQHSNLMNDTKLLFDDNTKMGDIAVLSEGCAPIQSDLSRIFLVVCSGRTRGVGHKLEHEKVCVPIRKRFIALWVTEHWQSLGSLLLGEVLRSHLDMGLGTLLEQGWGQMVPELPTNLSHSVNIDCGCIRQTFQIKY